MKNRTVKRVLALAVTAALAGSMVACGGGDGAQSEGSQEETASQEEAADGAQSEETADADSGSGESASGETYKIGVIQYMPHTALDASNEGFSPLWMILESATRKISRTRRARRPPARPSRRIWPALAMT